MKRNLVVYVLAPDLIIIAYSAIKSKDTKSCTCAQIITSDGYSLPWVNQIRYLTTGRQVRCSVSEAKRSFFDPLRP